MPIITRITFYILFIIIIECGCTSREFFYPAPEVFFQEHKILEPTAIITIGMSGSGKSTWSEVGENYGWVIIDSDKENYEILKEMRIKGEIAQEVSMVPNELNSYHLYVLRNKGVLQANIKLEKYINAKQSFIYDSLGLNQERNKLTNRLRENGYNVWYLIFKSGDISLNRYNLFVRESKGGFASFKGLPIEERCFAINRMLTLQSQELNKTIENFNQNGLKYNERYFFTQVKDLRASGITFDPCL